MKSVNKIILIGNLTRDPEVVQVREGIEVAKFSLAINDSYKKQTGETVDQTIYVDCEAWSGLAKVVSQYLKKGSKIYVEGTLKSDVWTDADSGKQRTKFKVRLVDMVMLDSRRDGDGGGFSGGAPKQNSSYDDEPQVKSVDDDELPF